MRILLCSHWFYPSFGGVESISAILAEEWSALGHEVTVVTHSVGDSLPEPYTTVRRPATSQLLALGRWADVIVQNIISLRTLIPLLVCRKPVVVIHNSWLRKNDGTLGWENRVKLALVRVVNNVSISTAIAQALPVPSEIIGNPFATEDFAGLRDRPRSRDIVFMGRLVSDKGVDTLLEGIGALRQRGHRPTLTIIGDGPEMPKLRALAHTLDIESQVDFKGALREGRGEIVAMHRIMAVPSRWAEPFGIVALEGIASGCAIVASSQGGLGEAAGPCGILFPNGDSAALAQALEKILTSPALQKSLIDAGPEHLKRFQGCYVAERYVELFRKLVPHAE